MILRNSTPELYGEWLNGALQRTLRPDGSPIAFVNAWNEWAEGAHLEPCREWGRAYLEATRRSIEAAQRTAGRVTERLPEWEPALETAPSAMAPRGEGLWTS